MSRAHESPGIRIRALWTKLSPLPGGRWLFSRLLGRMVPYSGTIRATVVRLEPGSVAVRLKDRRGIRNHLESVHAIAIANLGELTTGLAMLGALPPTVRGILKGLQVEYLKKGRGTLQARAECEIPVVTEPTEHAVIARISDTAGDEVATVRARWLLSPVPRP